MRKSLLAMAAALIAAETFAIQGTVYTDSGEPMTGEITWQKRQRTYLVNYRKGKTTLNAEFKLDEVTKLEIPKPAQFDRAVEAVDKGQGASAIKALEQIVAEYQMLNWDKPAGRYLALAYVSAGQPAKGLEVCEAIIRDDKTAAYSGDVAPAYWTCLMKLGRTEQLERNLAKAASSGSRQSSAAALIMRGDMIVDAGGDKPDVLKQALRDGYLRVGLMYGDCPDEKREALMKAAACFDKMGQASRAQRLREQAQ